MSSRPVLFLDRDGVINIDHAYVCKPKNFELFRTASVGDEEADIQASVAVGVGCNLLYIPSGLHDEIETAASAVVERLSDIGEFLCPCQIMRPEK